MKRTIPKLSLLCLTAGLFTGVASAQTSVYIDNPGFELPNTVKINHGWDVSGSDVPGWMDAATGNRDSGIENPGSGQYSGNCGAYSMGGDPGAYQITTNTMAFGQQYTLTWYAKEVWGGSVQRVSLLRANSPSDPFASCTELQVSSQAYADYSWAQYTLVYVAGSADVGKYIGIHFSNTGPDSGCWNSWDDFSMTVVQVDPLPHITTQPVSQTVYEGSSATFTAAATGPDLSYQWKAGVIGSGVYTNVPGATTTTLTIPYARASADYVLYVSNSAGSDTSSPATLTVTPATYTNGLFNGDFELPATAKINSGFDVPGANDVPGWRNAGPNQNDEGIESAGSGRNGTWCAYLHRGQSGAYQITPAALQLGDSIILTWWTRNEWMGCSNKVSILSASSQDAAFGSTTILASRTDDVEDYAWNQYTLTYTAGAGDVGKLLGVAIQTADPSTVNGWSAIDDMILDVTHVGPPVIITQPSSQTGWLAGNATFTVVAGGGGLSYQWQAGAVGSGVYTNISNGGQFSGANTASLTISNLTVANGLDYVVTVSNGAGSTNSTPATLTVDTSVPTIWQQPASATRLTTETVTFTVGAAEAVTYQWKAGAVGSGTYTNLSNGGQFSGVNTATLTIANLQQANAADYAVEVSNGAGPVTSTPATLTILGGIYIETFETNSPLITSLGWAADANNGAYGHMGNPYWGGTCIWAAGPSGLYEAYYTSTALNNGSIPGQMAFPLIRLAEVSNMTFYVDVQSWWNPGSIHTYFAVQMNYREWYASATELTQATGSQATQTMTFDPTASAWNQLTVSGTGCTNSASMPLIGSAATADLSGYITGAGLVNLYDGSSWINMDNFKISGDGFIAHPDPALKITPSGSDVILTWAYGTLVESTSVNGPWTTVSGGSPKTVPATGDGHFYRVQLP